MAIAIVLLVYGLITEVGGVMGYVKAKSKASLVAGMVCGGLLMIAGVLMLAGMAWAFWLGLAMNIVLIVVFWKRYAKTQAVMPAGVMLGISVVVAGVLFTEFG